MGSQVTVSSRYQIVIPKEARERAKLKPGEKLSVFVRHGQITLVRVRPFEELIGIAKGINIEGLREEEDRL
jgi:AbrB family looped-hinge helix DNA binding protein